MELGKIVPVPIREVWQGEATDFTPWLAGNLDVLSDKLDIDLALEEQEGPAGTLSVDIVARDLGTNKLVVIENQFGITDHKHLGQLITYAAERQAGVAIWISEFVRGEHKTAINMLNQQFGDRLHFFAIEVKIIRIDASNPAISMDVVCEPSAPRGIIVPGDADDKKKRYKDFFQSLIDVLRNEYKFTNTKSGQPQNWYTFASDNSKIYKYGMSFAQHDRARVEVYIDCKDGPKNDAIFNFLHQKKDLIEKALGEEAKWEDLPGKQACRIAVYRDGSIDDDSELLEVIKNWGIEKLLKFKEIFPDFFDEALKNIDSEPRVVALSSETVSL